MALFVDESNKDRKAAGRKIGYSQVGTRMHYRSLFNMDTRCAFIGVAECFGFVIPAYEILMHRYEETDEHKPVGAEHFVEFVRDKLGPTLGNYLLDEAYSVVIMDNCSIYSIFISILKSQGSSKLVVPALFTQLLIHLNSYRSKICITNGRLMCEVISRLPIISIGMLCIILQFVR